MTHGNPNGAEQRRPKMRPPGPAKPSRILVVLPKWVGDVVMATPALRAIRETFADAEIAWLMRSHLTPILDGCDRANEVICWPSGKGQNRAKRRKGFLGLSASVREKRYDWAVLLDNSFRSALLARLAGIPRRIGYDRDGRGLLLTDKLLPERYNGKYIPGPMIRYYMGLARYLGCRECSEKMELFTTAEEEAAADAAIEKAGVGADQPIVVLNPGASFGPAKCWLPERFAEVADQLVEKHNAAVFISCGPRETETARSIVHAMNQPVTSLDDPVMPLGPSKALIRRAALLVTNDTGPRHFAVAFDTPVVTVFGPTDRRWTLNDAPQERWLQVDVDCGPCMKRRCPEDHRCMTRVTTDMVLAEAEALLAARSAAR